jgi:hypothetical protein
MINNNISVRFNLTKYLRLNISYICYFPNMIKIKILLIYYKVFLLETSLYLHVETQI